MTFDQGAWDAITSLRNEMSRPPSADSWTDPAVLVKQLEAIEERLTVLEQRFTNLKKGVWSA